MPELPEVETVRRGLSSYVNGARIKSVEVFNPRAVRKNHGDLAQQIRDARIEHVSRRGKYMWFVLDGPDALVVHLGMSGQFRVHDGSKQDQKHVRVAFTLLKSHSNRVNLDFVDQRTFGGMHLSPLVRLDSGESLPQSVSHIARDPLDPRFNVSQFIRTISHKRTEIKRVLLDQSMISGIGNIYADESLFRARIHGATSVADLSQRQIVTLVSHATDVMNEALEQGGTSFDSLYVNVNGESGYFSRALAVYGRQGEPCDRCATEISRIHFMNRSSYFCPRCQPELVRL